jgi:hypothetical protein
MRGRSNRSRRINPAASAVFDLWHFSAVSCRTSGNPQPVLLGEPVPGFNDMTFFKGFFLVGVLCKKFLTGFVWIFCVHIISRPLIRI